MILLGLLYHAYLRVFGYTRTWVRMSDGGEPFWIPAPIEAVNRMWLDSFYQDWDRRWIAKDFIEAYRQNGKRVLLNPMQMCVWGEM